MKHERRLITGIMAALMALLSAHASAGTVELRSAARVTPGEAVTLADIAVLTGDDAKALGDLIVLDVDSLSVKSGRASIDIDRVRALIDARGVNWGLLTLRGGRCDLRVREAPAPARTAIENPFIETIDSQTEPTVRTFIEQRLRETFGVTDPSLMRIRFEKRDEDLLSMTLAGRLVDAHTTGSSVRVPVSVSVYEGERLLERRSIRVEAHIQREVCVLKAPLRRGERIGEQSFTRETRWMATDTSPLSPAEAVIAEAKSSVDAGVVLERRHVEAPVVVRRGGLVIVHYLSGPVILKTKARAMSDGRMGERIKFEALGTKRRFMARVDGADRAVVRRESEPPKLIGNQDQTAVTERPREAQRPGIAVTRAE